MLGATVLIPALSFGIEISEMQENMKGNLCPRDTKEVSHLSGEDCRRICPDLANECIGPRTKCWENLRRDNEIISAYNAWLHGCKLHTEPTNQPPHGGRALANEIQEAKSKAEEAKSKALGAVKEAKQKRAADQTEKNTLKEAAKSTPSWCQSMINGCEQRVSSLANATRATQSQCKAYCQILQVEDCNGASSTVQEAAQACTAGSERDQRTAAESARNRQAEERRKWHCFGAYGDVRQGYNECKRECSAYFPSNHCENVCYSSGDGSISNGRSCYREP